MSGKKISIFLVEGSPLGLRTAEIGQWTGKAVAFPRLDFAKAQKREELKSPGIYFLFGETDELDRVEVYVGEAENLISRLENHNKNKEFWNEAVCFLSKDEHFNKAHITFLESMILSMLEKSERCALKNNKSQSQKPLSEAEIAEMQEFFENLVILLPTLGYRIFEGKKHISSKQETLFFCKGAGGAIAKGYPTENGFRVLKESIARIEISQGTPPNGILKRREILLHDKKIRQEKEGMKFIEDVEFSSVSTASCFILGRSSNGWIEWKNKDGKTLDEVVRNVKNS